MSGRPALQKERGEKFNTPPHDLRIEPQRVVRQRTTDFTTAVFRPAAGSVRAERQTLIRYPHLLESPLAGIRRRHGLDPATAAERLHIPVLRLARLEQATRRFPARELAAYRRLLEPEPRLVQAVLFDAIFDEEGVYVGEIGQGEAGFASGQTGLPKNFSEKPEVALCKRSDS